MLNSFRGWKGFGRIETYRTKELAFSYIDALNAGPELGDVTSLLSSRADILAGDEFLITLDQTEILIVLLTGSPNSPESCDYWS